MVSQTQEAQQQQAQAREGSGAPAVELKGTVFTLPVLRLSSVDLELIEQELSERLNQSLRFFEHAPVVIDLEQLSRRDDVLDFQALAELLRRKHLVPVGVRNPTEEQQGRATEAGLAVLKGSRIQDLIPATVTKKEALEPIVSQSKTLFIEQPVRSGQQIYAAGADLVVLAPVNAGAEIIADGNIHVYAPLRGRALAGVQGDVNARIFAASMEPQLLSIAGNYQVFEESLPDDVCGKPAQVCLHDTSLVIEPIR